MARRAAGKGICANIEAHTAAAAKPMHERPTALSVRERAGAAKDVRGVTIRSRDGRMDADEDVGRWIANGRLVPGIAFDFISTRMALFNGLRRKEHEIRAYLSLIWKSSSNREHEIRAYLSLNWKSSSNRIISPCHLIKLQTLKQWKWILRYDGYDATYERSLEAGPETEL